MALAVFIAVPEAAYATIITITFTGTVGIGTDNTGVFVSKGASLAGLPFTATFTFDDTLGEQQSGLPDWSEIYSTVSDTGQTISNPGTAVLKIGTGTCSFGNLPNSTSITERVAWPWYATGYQDATVYNGTHGGFITIGQSPANNAAVTDGNWEDDVSLSGPFIISNGNFFFCNDSVGDILANGTFDGPDASVTTETVVGLPARNPGGPLTVYNPYALYAPSKLAPPAAIDLPTVLSSPIGTSLAADGKSALVLVYQSPSSQPTVFSVTGSGNGLPTGASVGTIGNFNPDFLVSPQPTGYASPPIEPYSCDQFGNCTFVALLWGPSTFPSPDGSPAVVNLTVTATQPGAASPPSTVVQLVPPPVVLVHGLWDDATNAWNTPGQGGLLTWLYTQYPSPVNLVSAADYGFGPPACTSCTPGETLSAKEFDNLQIQSVLEKSVDSAVARANNAGIAARTVDIVAHSMGGLVTRYYMTNKESAENAALLANPIHNLITIGTPHQGTALATELWNNQNTPIIAADLSPVVAAECTLLQLCTAGTAFDLLGLPIDSAVQSLEPGSPQLTALSSSTQYDSIVGESPSPISLTEGAVDLLILAFDPPKTVSSILNGQLNDVVVPIASQTGNCYWCTTVPDVVHTGIVEVDCDEKHNEVVWSQAYYLLTGGTGNGPLLSIPAPLACNANSDSNMVRPNTLLSSGPPPNLTLTGYTQVSASNVAITPASGTPLTIGTATGITASSTTKTITEVLLLQGVADPTDTRIAYATQSPFTISYTPTRLGTATFSAITVFNDSTYALTTLTYPLQIAGSPVQLTLMNAPSANMSVGDTAVVQTSAQFSTGDPVNVTQLATYTTQSGTSNVFSVGAGGTITATGPGTDRLNVSYGGLTASAPVSVGTCTYSLSPAGQIVPYTGGTVDIGVTAPSGCAWTAAGGNPWLTFTNASGLGSGTITLTAAANTSGNAQQATITLANTSSLVEQPATSCTYMLSVSQINVLPRGGSGTIGVTTSCPIVASSNASWVTVTGTSSPIAYMVSGNTETAQRTATLTIGTQTVQVVQGALSTPTVTVTPKVSSITTKQSLQVSVTVIGGSGDQTPTGSVVLSSGTYNSAGTTLSNGVASITVLAGQLAAGSDTLTATYTPDSSSAYIYNSATGTAPVTVAQAIGSCTTANPNPNPNPASFAAVADFNGDCKSDILWRNTGTQQVYEWFMNGTTYPSSGSPGSPTADWVIQGVGDFNGDGKADILWRNSDTGEVFIWLMNGSTLSSSGSLGYVSSDWSVAGVGDFNGDGKADILWWNSSTGQVYVWFINGTTMSGGGSVSYISGGWTIQGVGDFNGDGKADILWRNSSTGQVFIWLMNGSTLTSSGSVSYVTSDWSIAGVGDFNNDGKSDILWRNSTTGQVYVWYINGTTMTGGGSVTYVSSAWVIDGLGDYDGSGRAGILWRNTSTEQVYIWLMNGATLTSSGSPGAPDATWQIASLAP
ncbi:MAG: FG-GAP-like repeat-containing protein [Acidobacteriaceae bacterium]